MNPNRCLFCHLERTRIRLENDVAAAIPDAFPAAEGHTLVVPKRHVASVFDLTEEDQIDRRAGGD
jgi:diadenosine tetraphosphate (Ap4A) HIT family hydrolase